MNTITAEELKDLIETEEENLIVINVLNPDSFESCRIAGSINMPIHDRENFRQRARNLDKDKKIVVYCASYECPASRKAYEELVAMEILDEDNLRAYEGGVKEWQEKGFPTEGTQC